jgi:hypothetical protein
MRTSTWHRLFASIEVAIAGAEDMTRLARDVTQAIPTTAAPDCHSGLVGNAKTGQMLRSRIAHLLDQPVERLVQERRIPFIKWGHPLRFDPDEIDAWVDIKRVPCQPGSR